MYFLQPVIDPIAFWNAVASVLVLAYLKCGAKYFCELIFCDGFEDGSAVGSVLLLLSFEKVFEVIVVVELVFLVWCFGLTDEHFFN